MKRVGARSRCEKCANHIYTLGRPLNVTTSSKLLLHSPLSAGCSGSRVSQSLWHSQPLQRIIQHTLYIVCTLWILKSIYIWSWIIEHPHSGAYITTPKNVFSQQKIWSAFSHLKPPRHFKHINSLNVFNIISALNVPLNGILCIRNKKREHVRYLNERLSDSW